MSLDLPGPAGRVRATVGEPAGGPGGPGDPAVAVTALYAEHALGLTRLALVMVRDRQAAEDIVQDAFCGLHRLWPGLRDKNRALPYVRSAVLNGCRSEFRRQRRDRSGRDGYEGYLPPAWSAESEAEASAERARSCRP
jgi:DNA-directed RNA polymerase specialized sigma24 family protein